VKYPTFSPWRGTDVSTDQLASAFAPIPVRPQYPHHGPDDGAHNQGQRQQLPQAPQQLPPTPAPSPPPNAGKPKKQQYQTDPNRPFLFPFSYSRGSSQKLVPFAIDEADRLYMRHMHVSLSLFQTWQTREAFLLEETGTDPYSPEGQAALEKKAVAAFGSSVTKAPRNLLLDSTLSDDEPPEASLPDVRRLDATIAEAQAQLDKAYSDGDNAGRRKAKERKDDLVRLRRVETFYVGF
jgi:hypothetical protein